MMQFRVDEEDVPRFGIFAKGVQRNNLVLEQDQAILGSGKFAVASILKHLRDLGQIEDKTKEVLVPKWIGQWVYRAMLGSTFPSTTYSTNTACIYVYHQFGFLQDLDYIYDFARANRLPIIEDSAHLLHFEEGKLQNKFIGDYNISSPSKFINSPSISVIETDDAELLEKLAKLQYSESSLYSKLNLVGRLFLDSTFVAKRNSIFKEKVADILYSSYLTTSSASNLAVKRLGNLQFEHEKRLRRVNLIYKVIPNEYLPKRDHLQSSIAPLKVPIVLPTAILNHVTLKRNYNKFLVNFDENRNMLKPKFVLALALPMHSEISDAIFNNRLEEICECL